LIILRLPLVIASPILSAPLNLIHIPSRVRILSFLRWTHVVLIPVLVRITVMRSLSTSKSNEQFSEETLKNSDNIQRGSDQHLRNDLSLDDSSEPELSGDFSGN
jgi:hypothetical protein